MSQRNYLQKVSKVKSVAKNATQISFYKSVLLRKLQVKR